jgi:hypothetical protein
MALIKTLAAPGMGMLIQVGAGCEKCNDVIGFAYKLWIVHCIDCSRNFTEGMFPMQSLIAQLTVR